MAENVKKIQDINAARQMINTWKLGGETIVFTNGCFDILHLGHVDYLERAAQLGDRLVVGLNTDESVTQLKGSGRPVQDQETRSRIIAALSSVDLVVLFNEKTPLNLITELLPDVLVKGSDYLAENIVGAEVVKKEGGRVETLDFIEGHSTSRIIERIKKLN
ncbi:MAG: D-glycero-beta-D-manno-heptose 1-phosphate adenylyltransferase [Flammeovirgaceae bacterium]|nr:D-glycero-beta-D-manno-heptose 1-phosphate adenylyltransferase [Flammeovirgaceae bacterium]